MALQRVLIVEDELKLLRHLSDTIGAAGFSVFTTATYNELETMLRLPVKRFDVIVLDRLLVGRDSASLIGTMKKEVPDAKIIVVSAINTAAEKAALLDMGADDYLSKPLDSEELIARIRALLRRNRPEIILGDATLNTDTRALRVRDVDVALTNKEFALLRTLMKSPGKVFSKSFISEQVWEMSAEADSNVVEVTVNKIRKRLADAGASVAIKNTRNIGYWIEE